MLGTAGCRFFILIKINYRAVYNKCFFISALMVKTLLSAEYLCTSQRSRLIFTYAEREMMMSKNQSKDWAKNQSLGAFEAFLLCVGDNFTFFVFTAKCYWKCANSNILKRSWSRNKRGKRVVSKIFVWNNRKQTHLENTHEDKQCKKGP